MKPLIDETTKAKWATLFENESIKPLILDAVLAGKKSVLLDYWDIDVISPELSQSLLDNPSSSFWHAEMALADFPVISPDDKKVDLTLRVTNLSDIAKIAIHDIRSKHTGKLISVSGIVRKRAEVRPKLVVGAFMCNKCGCVMSIDQAEDIIIEPTECYEDEGGFGRKSSFKLISSLSQFIDSQKLELQENLEGMKESGKITIYMEHDLAGTILPGDHVVINGVLFSSKRRRANYQLASFDKALYVNSCESIQKSYEDVVLSDLDIRQIENASRDPELFEKFIQSLAPSIHGLYIEKFALLLQLFGGVMKQTEPGVRLRGDIHILFVGDPGTAKSQLLSRVSKLSPRAIFTSGKGSSASGLTASCVKDEFGDGQWTLEAGALVLADGGLAVVDELDKMSKEDRDALHEAMEQQFITINKAGINATLQTRCSLLSAANPKLGRFDQFAPVADQIDLPVTLLSRFDLIFPILDKPNAARDAMLVSHIRSVHQHGIIEENQPFSSDFITKYVCYARRLQPKLGDKACDIIDDFFKTIRGQSVDSVAITARQLEAMYRLAEASAKVRLSETVEEEDANHAVNVFQNYLKRVASDYETGALDIDLITVGKSHSQQEMMRKILTIVTSFPVGATEDNILIECEKLGMNREKSGTYLEKLHAEGRIFKMNNGRYKVA